MMPKVRNKLSGNLSEKRFFGKFSKKLSWKLVSNQSMSMKLSGSYLIIILFLGFISFVSYMNLNKLNDQMLNLGKKQVPELVLIGNLKDEVTNIRLNSTRHAYEKDEDERANLEKVIKSDVEKIVKNSKELNQGNISESDKQLLAEFNKAFKEYVDIIPSFFQTSKSNDYYSVHGKLGVLAYQGDNTITRLDKVAQSVQKHTTTIITDSEKDTSRSISEIIVVFIIAALFSILISIVITKLIGRSVRQVGKNIGITTNSANEIKRTIDKTAISAKELETSMNKTNDSVSELVASIQQVAGNTTETATGVDEISAAIEEMSASINLVAGSAGHLDASAE